MTIESADSQISADIDIEVKCTRALIEAQDMLGKYSDDPSKANLAFGIRLMHRLNLLYRGDRVKYRGLIDQRAADILPVLRGTHDVSAQRAHICTIMQDTGLPDAMFHAYQIHMYTGRRFLSPSQTNA